MIFFSLFGFMYLFFIFFLLFIFSKSSILFDFFLFSWGGLDFSLSLIFDYISLGFFSSVSFISGLVFFILIFM